MAEVYFTSRRAGRCIDLSLAKAAIDIVYTCIYNGLMFLYDVVKAMKESKVPFVIVGGYALAIHGLVRATMDVDIVISLKEVHLKEAEKAMTKLGLHSRIPVRAEDVFRFRKEYIDNRNLIAWSFVDHANPTRQIDILITHAYEDLEITSVAFGGHKIPVVSLRGLMDMKQKAGRPQDLIDVENIQEKLRGKKK